MRTNIRQRLARSIAAKAFALVLVCFLWFGEKTYAATDWSAIQDAMHANGMEMPGGVLRFELVRQDLTVTIAGQAVPRAQSAAVTNGFIGFKEMSNGEFFADGSLPAQESEVAELETALRRNPEIHITAVVNRVLQESPRLIWVEFEATGNSAALATSISTALETIHSPQLNVPVILGTNTVFDPAQILSPQLLTLFNEGFIEAVSQVFVFYLPRPDESRFSIHGVSAETGLGVGQSFYIQISLSGGTAATLNVDMALRPPEVEAVEDTLRAGGFTITSLNHRFIDVTPRLFFIHATASGDGFSLGNALYQAIQIIQTR